MAFPSFDKMVSPTSLLAVVLILVNVNKGHCLFYPSPNPARLQGQQETVFDSREPQNVVGYGYKPSWTEVHFQPYLQESNQQQEQLQNVIKDQQVNEQQPLQQAAPEQKYLVPSHTYLFQQHQQPLEKYQVLPNKYQIAPPEYQVPLQKYHVSAPGFQYDQQKYQIPSQKFHWQAEPSVQYQVPGLSNPFYHHEPQHQNVLLPLRFFGVQSFPPFIERLINRVQNYYSVYNPPELLTVPYHMNTPPTFTASGLLPPNEDSLVPIDNNGNNEAGVSNSVESNSESGANGEDSTDKPTSFGDNGDSDNKDTTDESSTDETSTDTSSQSNAAKKEDSGDNSTSDATTTETTTTTKKSDDSDDTKEDSSSDSDSTTESTDSEESTTAES